jgi:hypothetical protein
MTNPYESPLVPTGPGPVPAGPLWDQVAVEYQLTIGDYIAFNMQHTRRSRSASKGIRTSRPSESLELQPVEARLLAGAGFVVAQ